MPVYRIGATERIFEEAYVIAKDKEEAVRIASDDWTLEWETFEGDDFEIEEVEELTEDEVAQMKWLKETSASPLTDE